MTRLPLSIISILTSMTLLPSRGLADLPEEDTAPDASATEAAPPFLESEIRRTDSSASEPSLGESDDAFQTRFRFGVNALGGFMVGSNGGSAIATFGVDSRFGAQLSPSLGIYGQPLLLVGSDSGATHVISGVDAMIEFAPSDNLFLGFGPELGVYSASFGGFGASTGIFGLASRLGWVFGDVSPTRRRGFLLALENRIVGALSGGGGVLISPTLALGYESF